MLATPSGPLLYDAVFAIFERTAASHVRWIPLMIWPQGDSSKWHLDSYRSPKKDCVNSRTKSLDLPFVIEPEPCLARHVIARHWMSDGGNRLELLEEVLHTLTVRDEGTEASELDDTSEVSKEVARATFCLIGLDEEEKSQRRKI